MAALLAKYALYSCFFRMKSLFEYGKINEKISKTAAINNDGSRVVFVTGDSWPIVVFHEL